MSRKRDRAKRQRRLEWFIAAIERTKTSILKNMLFHCHDCQDDIGQDDFDDYDDNYDDDFDYDDDDYQYYRDQENDDDDDDDFFIDDSPLCTEEEFGDGDDIPF